MALLKAPSKQPKTTTLQVRLEEEVRHNLRRRTIIGRDRTGPFTGLLPGVPGFTGCIEGCPPLGGRLLPGGRLLGGLYPGPFTGGLPGVPGLTGCIDGCPPLGGRLLPGGRLLGGLYPGPFTGRLYPAGFPGD